MTTNLKKQVYNEFVKKTSYFLASELTASIKECNKLVSIVKKWDGKKIDKDLINSLNSLKSFKRASFELCLYNGQPTIRETKNGLYDVLSFNIYGGDVVDAQETIKDLKFLKKWYELIWGCWWHIWRSFDYKEGEHDEFLNLMSKPLFKNWHNCLLKSHCDYVVRGLQEWDKERVAYLEYRNNNKAA